MSVKPFVQFTIPSGNSDSRHGYNLQTDTMLRLLSGLLGQEIKPSRRDIIITCTTAQWGEFILLRHLKGHDKNWIAYLFPEFAANGKVIEPKHIYDFTQGH